MSAKMFSKVAVVLCLICLPFFSGYGSNNLSEGFVVTDRVEITTNMGSFVVGLYGNDAPITVTNFLRYVNEGFYDGLIFHRIIPDFMIQGGGFDQDFTPQEGYDPITLEIIDGIQHLSGTISMARTSEPNSATSQFFICVGAQPHLDGQYAAFGMVESGYDVVEAISLVPTRATRVGFLRWYRNVPVEMVIIESMKAL